MPFLRYSESVFEPAQTFDGGTEPHTTNNRMGLRSPNLFFWLAVTEHRRPAARAGVAVARSVRYRDMMQYLGMLLKNLKLVG